MKINPMKNLMTFGLALASLTLAATGCSENKSTTETTTTTPATEATAMSADSTSIANGMATTYTCPMHPEVVSNQPGQCPKCHMDLVKK